MFFLSKKTSTRTEFLGDMMELCYNHLADELEHSYIDSASSDSQRALLTCIIPLREVVTNFFDKLKGRSSGFASFEWVLPLFLFIIVTANHYLPLVVSPSYEDAGYRSSKLSKVRGSRLARERGANAGALLPCDR